MKFSPRYLVGVNLVLLALVAYFGAATVSSAIAAWMAPPVSVRLSPPPPPLEHAGKRPLSHYASIHRRDLFNSVAKAPDEPPPPPPPVKTELRLKLWGVAVRDNGNSYCIIEDVTTRQQELYRENDVVGQVATVKRVEWQRVILERDGREEILLLETPGSVTAGVPAVGAAGRYAGAAQPGFVDPRARAAAAEQAQVAQAGTNAAGGDFRIEQVGDGEYVIDREEVDAALDNMNQLFTQVRAVPHFQGGKSTGFRLFAIRQGSLFDKIGLRNGDIIQRVNGNDISDPSKALGLFQQLRNERQITADIVRNKEEKTLSYSFR